VVRVGKFAVSAKLDEFAGGGNDPKSVGIEI